MTLGSSFYAILQLLRAMLNPTQPGEGLLETRWLILRISPRGQDVPMGSLELVVPNIVKNTTSILSSPAQFVKAPALPQSLSAPFPVPDTNIHLDPGPRGEELNFGQTITSLNGLLNNAWAEVAIHGTARAVNTASAYTRSANGVLCVLHPRMGWGVSFVSTTDLAEAVTGIVYYYTVSQAAFATSVTLLKPNGVGSIGSIEITAYRLLGSIDSENDTLVTTS
ncbi:MAG: hypothetical protein Q9228_006206 [Teloschistes exilis]